MTLHVSITIQITQAELNEARKGLKLNIPVYAATKRGKKISLVTRLGTQIYTQPSKPRSKAKKVTT